MAESIKRINDQPTINLLDFRFSLLPRVSIELHGVACTPNCWKTRNSNPKVSVPLLTCLVWCLSYFNLRLNLFPQHPSPKKDSFLSISPLARVGQKNLFSCAVTNIMYHRGSNRDRSVTMVTMMNMAFLCCGLKKRKRGITLHRQKSAWPGLGAAESNHPLIIASCLLLRASLVGPCLQWRTLQDLAPNPRSLPFASSIPSIHPSIPSIRTHKKDTLRSVHTKKIPFAPSLRSHI